MPDTLPPTPAHRRICVAVLVLSAVALLSVGVAVYLGAFALTQVLYAYLGFELVVLVSAVLGVCAGLGCFRPGYSMAVLCVAGAIGSATLLGFLDLRANLLQRADLNNLMYGLVATRIAVAGCLLVLAGFDVLIRKPGGFGHIAKGIVLLVPVLVAAGLVVVRPGLYSPLTTATTGLGELIRLMALGLLSLTALILTCLGGHHLIVAFDRVRPGEGIDRPAETSENPPKGSVAPTSTPAGAGSA